MISILFIRRVWKRLKLPTISATKHYFHAMNFKRKYTFYDKEYPQTSCKYNKNVLLLIGVPSFVIQIDFGKMIRMQNFRDWYFLLITTLYCFIDNKAPQVWLIWSLVNLVQSNGKCPTDKDPRIWKHPLNFLRWSFSPTSAIF